MASEDTFVEAPYGFLVVAAAAACLTAVPARAEEVVLMSPVVPYGADSASEDVRRDCTWNSTMPRYLAGESEGRVKVLEQGIDEASERKLALVATLIHTAPGGGFSGPKWLTMEGKLTEGGKLLGNFEARRQTIRGSMRGCATLDALSEDIASDILEWLKAPSLNAKLGDAK
jgi:hypothetical protein